MLVSLLTCFYSPLGQFVDQHSRKLGHVVTTMEAKEERSERQFVCGGRAAPDWRGKWGELQLEISM